MAVDNPFKVDFKTEFGSTEVTSNSFKSQIYSSQNDSDSEPEVFEIGDLRDMVTSQLENQKAFSMSIVSNEEGDQEDKNHQQINSNQDLLD